MKYLSWILLFGLFLFFGCSKEEPAPLPPLKKIDVPEGIVGLYAGRLPCDNCKANMVKVELNEDSTALVLQRIVTDSLETEPKIDTLHGNYSLNGDILSLNLSENSVHWKFKKGNHGSFALLTGAGTLYTDQDGFKAELIRIYVNPLRTPTDTAEGK